MNVFIPRHLTIECSNSAAILNVKHQKGTRVLKKSRSGRVLLNALWIVVLNNVLIPMAPVQLDQETMFSNHYLNILHNVTFQSHSIMTGDCGRGLLKVLLEKCLDFH